MPSNINQIRKIAYPKGAYNRLLHEVNNEVPAPGKKARLRSLKLETDASGLALGGSVIDGKVRRPLTEPEIVAIAVARIDAVYEKQAKVAVKEAVDAYATKVAKPGEYGTEVEIQALAEALQLEVVILTKDKQPIKEEPGSAQSSSAPIVFRPDKPASTLRRVALLLEHHSWAARNDNHFSPLMLTADELAHPDQIDATTLAERADKVRGDGNCLFASLATVLGREAFGLRALAAQWLRRNAQSSLSIAVDSKAKNLVYAGNYGLLA